MTIVPPLKEDEIILTLHKEQLTEFIRSAYEEREFKKLSSADLKTPLIFKESYKIGVIDNGAKIIVGASYTKSIKKDKSLINAVLKSYKWNRETTSGAKTGQQIAKEENVGENYIFRMINLSFLSTKIIISILEGKQPSDLTIQKLLKIKTPIWKEQEKELGF